MIRPNHRDCSVSHCPSTRKSPISAALRQQMLRSPGSACFKKPSALRSISIRPDVAEWGTRSNLTAAAIGYTGILVPTGPVSGILNLRIVPEWSSLFLQDGPRDLRSEERIAISRHVASGAVDLLLYVVEAFSLLRVLWKTVRLTAHGFGKDALFSQFLVAGFSRVHTWSQ